MIKVEPGTAENTYKINGVPRQSGESAIVVNGDLVGINETGSKRSYAQKVSYEEYRDENDQPFATVEDLVTYLRTFIFE